MPFIKSKKNYFVVLTPYIFDGSLFTQLSMQFNSNTQWYLVSIQICIYLSLGPHTSSPCYYIKPNKCCFLSSSFLSSLSPSFAICDASSFHTITGFHTLFGSIKLNGSVDSMSSCFCFFLCTSFA